MIEFNENTCQVLIDLHVVNLTESIATKAGKTKTVSLRELMASKTYALLLDPDSLLCLESPAYILDMYEAEQVGNWDWWSEI